MYGDPPGPLGHLPFLVVPYSMMIKIADSHNWNKKTYNNCISALRRAFAFGYLDYPDQRHPAASLRCARVGKKDRPQPIGAKLKATMKSAHSLLYF
jgi:hypothetical protein